MEERRALCGRDVKIFLDGRPLLQAETAGLRKTAQLHAIRSCFCGEDVAHLEGRREYKLNLTGVRFLAPFENCNFYDMDHFTVRVVMGDVAVVLENCVFDDFEAAADKERFREHISMTALRMRTEAVS